MARIETENKVNYYQNTTDNTMTSQYGQNRNRKNKILQHTTTTL